MPASQKRPSWQKKRTVQTVRKRQSRGKIYLVAAIIIILTIGVGLYVYVSSQASNSLPPVVYAKLNTSDGMIEVELYYNATPKTVANFVSLANSGFYTNLVWHRISKATPLSFELGIRTKKMEEVIKPIGDQGYHPRPFRSEMIAPYTNTWGP